MYMDFVELKGGLRVSRFTLGTWGMSGAKLWGENEEKDSIDTIHAAVEAGVNFIDSASAYGDGKSEEVLGKAIKGIRNKIVLATKVMDLTKVVEECEGSLRRIKTDCIDVYQIHWANPAVPFDETRRAFEKLQKDGKIRFMGVCNFGLKCLEQLKGMDVVTNQLPYNLLWRQIENGIVKASTEQGIGIWPYSPLAQGLLTGKFKTVDDVPMARRFTRYYSCEWKAGRHTEPGFEKEIFGFVDALRPIAAKSGFSMTAIALNWLKRMPEVCSINCGARTKAQLQDNLEAYAADVPDDVMAEVSRLSDELKPKMGDNPDMWQTNTRYY